MRHDGLVLANGLRIKQIASRQAGVDCSFSHSVCPVIDVCNNLEAVNSIDIKSKLASLLTELAKNNEIKLIFNCIRIERKGREGGERG